MGAGLGFLVFEFWVSFGLWCLYFEIEIWICVRIMDVGFWNVIYLYFIVFPQLQLSIVEYGITMTSSYFTSCLNYKNSN